MEEIAQEVKQKLGWELDRKLMYAFYQHEFTDYKRQIKGATDEGAHSHALFMVEFYCHHFRSPVQL